MATEKDLDDTFTDAITEVYNLSENGRFLEDSAKMYAQYRDQLGQVLPPNAAPEYGFLGFYVNGSRNELGFGCMLEDRLVFVWESGLFRRKRGAVSVLFSEVASLEYDESSQAYPALGGNPSIILHHGDTTTVLAVPKESLPFPAVMAQAVQSRIAG